jgi:hypothetical protein
MAKDMLTRAKEAIIGTPEQNAEATAKLKAMKSMSERVKEQEQGDAEKYFGLKKGAGKSWDDKDTTPVAKKKGGKVKAKCMARGGGCEVRGKTRGRMV